MNALNDRPIFLASALISFRSARVMRTLTRISLSDWAFLVICSFWEAGLTYCAKPWLAVSQPFGLGIRRNSAHFERSSLNYIIRYRDSGRK